MAWAGLFLICAWLVAAALLSRRCTGTGPVIRLWTFLNLLIGTFSWSVLCFSAATGLDTGIQLTLFGLGLSLPSLASQTIVGRALYANSRSHLAGRWSKREFMRLFVSQIVMFTMPAGLALSIVGLGLYVFHANLGIRNSIPYWIAIAVCVWLWMLVWASIRQMLIPGRIVDFPNKIWLDELRLLSERMGTGLRTCFLAQTTRRRSAGAYCLGSGRVGISDSLVSALDMEEFLAVMCHELRHLSHGRQTMRALVAGSAVTLTAGIGALQLGRGLGDLVVLLLSLSLMLLGAAASARLLMRLKRRQEDDADEAAIAFVGAPPLISGLSKAYYLNGVTDWEKGSVKYRSPLQRLERIARLGNLPTREARRTLENVYRAISAEETTSERRAS